MAPHVISLHRDAPHQIQCKVMVRLAFGYCIRPIGRHCN